MIVDFADLDPLDQLIEAQVQADIHGWTRPSDFPDWVPAPIAAEAAAFAFRRRGGHPSPIDDEDEPAPMHSTSAPALTFRPLADVAHRVRTSSIPASLVRRIFPTDGYGILGAEDKAGKTWAADDLALSVASGGRWLGEWQIDAPGPVLVFVGEGSERKVVRRLHAIGEHYGMTADGVDALPIRLCHRVPTLTNAAHLAEVRTELHAHPPRLVILDPLYLATGGVESSQLNKMGAVLGAIQYAAQEVGAALLVVHHWNKTGEGTGRKRFTGSGTAEWGRVLISMSVLKRRTEDPDGARRSVVDLKIEAIGDEIADEEATFRRTVWTDDPDSLDAPMHYAIERTHLDPTQRVEAGEWNGPTECMAALKHFFTERPDETLSKNATATSLRELGLNYRSQTIGDALERLATEGVLTVSKGARNARLFRLGRPEEVLIP